MPNQAAAVPSPVPSLQVTRTGAYKFTVEADAETWPIVKAALRSLLDEMGDKSPYELVEFARDLDQRNGGDQFSPVQGGGKK